MCGISGFVDFKRRGNEILTDMIASINHRGPDDQGCYFFSSEQYSGGLAHARLSILDLSKNGHQPMCFESLVMIYNGEVYNFKEIRLELEGKGYSFDSNSDTEVLLKSYHCWGAEAVNKFNGMFAIVIFDKALNKIIMFRDRSGVKPLYWFKKDDLFMFSSELKSFHQHPGFSKELNNDSLSLYLQHGYIPQPHTIFRNTYKLEAGHFLELDLRNFKCKTNKYWDVIDFYNKPKIKISEEEALCETETLLKSACEYRMVSDVPVGVFLSGGYDSSAVTALLQSTRTEKLKTFSIGFNEERFNEAHYAKKVANYLGTEHTEYYCTQKDALNIIPNLPNIWDEPFGDVSAIPTTLVSQLARKNVTVSLSADGGDEIFAGYDKYQQILKLQGIFTPIPCKKTISNILDFAYPHITKFYKKNENFNRRYNKAALMLATTNESEKLKLISCYFTPKEINELLNTEFGVVNTCFDDIENLNSNLGSLDKMLAIDYKTYQSDDILTKVDRATMSVGLEGREPLLDYRLIEFIAQLDPSLKIKSGEKKYLLKTIVHKYIPKEIMDRPKMGFGVPISDWFKDELKELLMFYLEEGRLLQSKIFNVSKVISIRDSYLLGNDANVNKVWCLLMFELWREKWM
ncbi:Asparagine synthetase [glutamine-hydrolyzing] 1 [Marinomonas spartinae]|uniref:asparagine synthase (glutamine-hydrolyzing) n=1 Tax=Marinomonas spartinae TaxID=1792290 RepID=A0A1A8T4W7_9GAMM|nr:asparagine synthase (glutamine-hydrolyzing) [Marinomonas spartinae]SBS27002.1 Asparagine synthetase [glutamine-hydrolyzing] 1 [Marinomonas spartinae]